LDASPSPKSAGRGERGLARRAQGGERLNKGKGEAGRTLLQSGWEIYFGRWMRKKGLLEGGFCRGTGIPGEPEGSKLSRVKGEEEG